MIRLLIVESTAEDEGVILVSARSAAERVAHYVVIVEPRPQPIRDDGCRLVLCEASDDGPTFCLAYRSPYGGLEQRAFAVTVRGLPFHPAVSTDCGDMLVPLVGRSIGSTTLTRGGMTMATAALCLMTGS